MFGDLKGLVRRNPWFTSARLARIRRITKDGGHPDWRVLIGEDWPEWERARRDARGGPKVLMETGFGAHLGLAAIDSVLAVALTLRGAEVEFALCDKLLPACQPAEISWYPDVREFSRNGPRKLCDHCFGPAADAFGALGLAVHRYGACLTDEDVAEAAAVARETPALDIATYVADGVPVGEHALAGALRFFARGTLAEEPEGEPVLRRYFQAALLTARSLSRLMVQQGYHAAVIHHGIYVPQGLANAVASQAGTRVVTWNPAYRKHSFIFSHGDTYHRTLMDEPVALWEGMAWSDALERRIGGYLQSRWTGEQDWIWFHESPVFDPDGISSALGIDFTRPTIGLLTNVVWDAQLHYPANAFASMVDWLTQTIRHFQGRRDLNLLIRVHPAEIRGAIASRQPARDEIAAAFPTLPPNVFVIGPESRISTYAAMERCNAVLIYGTKTGVELTSMGIPVITAGEAWIRNKGLTCDAATPAHYFALLNELPFAARLPDETVRRARKYAFHFFFRRMIPLDFVQPTGHWPPYRLDLSGLDRLRPGNRSLDVICDGILNGSPFIFPAENLSLPGGSAG